MPAKLIDGKSLSASIREKVAADVAALKAQNKPVKLIAILVGDNPAAKVYADNQKKTCAQVGIDYELHTLPSTTTRDQLHSTIKQLNADPTVTGIFLHSPLPNNLDLQDAQYQIDILKDVEGVNPANIGHVVYGHTIIAPCTALAVVELIDSTGTQLQGASVTVVGASRIVGRPLALLLTERNATVTLCHIHTKDTPAETRRADIVVVAVGKPALLRADHIKPGAVVIDVGINRVRITDAFGKITEKTIGDVDFDEVAKVASHITPVPGGVGPMTVAMLLRNTLRAAKLVHGLEKPFAGSA
ncbi:MAG TPA: bifunctional 5,10-methylenetetrahydrofolate dehydrogenase/5,10-methenyltetrahydrofolate cyclohydrolase [Phycisphaerae bacterium]|nr:bifunctional 5,10-methylenetetrahydrofolate dehydrogenase/5,10-methenyltetrahydrofolate cyclohydrolase [Phycisphaerae bacterium]